jgi:hypothetical protein
MSKLLSCLILIIIVIFITLVIINSRVIQYFNRRMLQIISLLLINNLQLKNIIL